MFRTFQGRKCRSNNRISVGSCRSYYTGSKRRIISTAMLHMKHQCSIQYLCFQFCIFLIRPQHKQNIFCCRQIRLWTMDIKTFITDIMIISMVSINCKHRHFTDQFHTLHQYVLQGGITDIIIIRCQCQYTSGQGIHQICTRCFHNDISRKICRQMPCCCQRLTEVVQLFPGREFTKQQ